MDPYQGLFNYFLSKTELTEAEFEKFSHLFKLRKVKRNEFLLREGETCNFNLFVAEGCLRIFTINLEGQELTRYFAFESKFGTTLSSLIQGQPSAEYIQAVEKSAVLMISKADFFHLVETVPQVNRIYRDLLEMAYITSQKRIYDLQGKTALERFQWLLTHQPGILTRLPNKLVASYLGVTPYTLSRLKSSV